MLITWDRDLELAGPSAHYQSLCPACFPCAVTWEAVVYWALKAARAACAWK